VLWPEEICQNPPPEISCKKARPSAQDSRLVFEISNAKVAGEARILATGSNVVMANMQGLFGVQDPLNHHFLEPKLRIPKHLPGRSLIIAGATEPNYYHWLFDCLPRLHLAHCAGINLDAIDHFLLMKNPPEFVSETLSAMGIPKSKHISLHSKEVLQCERLVATEMPTPFDSPPEWIVEFLKGLLSAPAPRTATKFIYFSRNDARSRRLANEDELLRELIPLGFENVSAAGLSVSDQSTLFASAKLVVSVHGAGLANILFSPPETTVVELYNPGYDNDCFQRLGESLGQKFVRIQCRPAGQTAHLPTQRQDIIVPVDTTVDLIRREITLLGS